MRDPPHVFYVGWHRCILIIILTLHCRCTESNVIYPRSYWESQAEQEAPGPLVLAGRYLQLGREMGSNTCREQ